MLIQNRDQFDQLINVIRASESIVFDVEATGVNLRHGDKTIGLAVYADEKSFYFPWAHGYNDQVNTNYSAMPRWSQPKKKALAMSLYFLHEQAHVIKENMPESWLDDLREVWLLPSLHIAHNAQFDLTALDLLDFPTPSKIADTMSMLSVVNSDWNGNRKDGYYPMFLMPDTGKLEMGTRGLKWQARLWGLEDSTKGIKSLEDSVKNLEAKIMTYNDQAILGANSMSAQGLLWMLKPSEVAPYAEDDVRLTYFLYNKILAYSDSWGDRALHDKYNDFTLMVWEMQKEGFKLDVAEAYRVIEEGKQELAKTEAALHLKSDGMISSANSPKQIKDYLDAVGIEVENTNSETLSGIDTEVTRLIEQVRSTKKLLTTYVEKWTENAVNGYIHPELNVGGAATARLTSSSTMFGNIQNIPRSSNKGINPKKLLLPPEGMILLDIDYQALEMRIAAWVAENIIGKGKSTVLTDLIEADTDMHLYTMEQSGIRDIMLNGKSEVEYLESEGYDLSNIDDPVAFVTKLARYAAKTTNFAALYGAGVRGIQKAAKCSAQHAQILLNGFHRAYPAVPEAMEYLEKLALTPRKLPRSSTTSPYVKYPLDELSLYRKFTWYPAKMKSAGGGSWSPRAKAARKAFNSVVQGTGGLIMLNSILRIKQRFGFAVRRGDTYDFTQGIVVPHTTVHDSVVLSIRPQDAGVLPEILFLMEDYPIRPRLKAEASYGFNYGETQVIKDVEEWIKDMSKV